MCGRRRRSWPCLSSPPCRPCSPPTERPLSFSTVPSLFPNFSPNIYNYVVRCNNGPVTVTGHTSGGWEAAIGNEPFRSGDFAEPVPLSSGRAFTITVRQVGYPQLYRYHVRCLPNDFPKYTFTRSGAVSPQFFLWLPTTSLWASQPSW